MKPPLFSCLTSRVAKNGSLYGRFLFGPLPIDISLTVATLLRRSLLHSQATFTIVSAEIEGATHEYASLPGIQESVLEILLNLGEIVLTSTQRNFISPNFRTSYSWSLGPSSGFYFAFIRVSGPCVVTAKDISWPKGIFCVKPNAYIATLSSNETLTMRLKILFLKKKKEKEKEKPTTTTTAFAAFSEIETKNLASENNFGLAKRLSPTKNLLDIDNTINIFHNKKTKNKQFFINNKNFFLFKLQRPITSVNSKKSKEKKEKPTEEQTKQLNNQFFFKNNLIPSKTLESRASAITNPLVALTKQYKTLYTKQTRFESYSIRKQNTVLPFSTRITKQTIFLENKTSVKNVSNGFLTNRKNEEKKEKEKPTTTTTTFRVFPGLFNEFDLPFIKNEDPESNVQESANFSHVLPVEELSKVNNKQQKKPFNIDTNTKSFPLPCKTNKQKKPKQKKTTKYELAVSSSSYPVEKVNFLIERDDELQGYRHRIILEVWTNGSISPRQAIFDSIGSIIKLIYNFREPLRNSFNQKFFQDSSVY